MRSRCPNSAVLARAIVVVIRRNCEARSLFYKYHKFVCQIFQDLQHNFNAMRDCERFADTVPGTSNPSSLRIRKHVLTARMSKQCLWPFYSISPRCEYDGEWLVTLQDMGSIALFRCKLISLVTTTGNIFTAAQDVFA